MDDKASGPSYARMTAEVYDALYEWKQYAKEAETIVEITKNRKSPGKALLDVACGTGNHIPHLQAHFDSITGIDLSPEQVQWAQQKFPSLSFQVANAKNFQLDRKFDVITCLFSSIVYLHPFSDVKQAVKTMADHLEPGGMVLIEPFFQPSEWKPGSLHANFVDKPELKISRISNSTMDGNDVAVLAFHHLVGRPTHVEHFIETHRMGLYTTEQYISAFEEAGLAVQCLKEELPGTFGVRGLIVGTKPV